MNTPAKSLTACLLMMLTCVSASATVESVDGYDRSEFGGWQDEDGNCRNTRHEVLVDLSTSINITMTIGLCRVVRGEWYDPYSDRILTEADDVDIDHLVPLRWAWDRGAWEWTYERRVEFGNDPANLIPVDDFVNAQKGARGPDKWLPPTEGFRCAYIVRFKRVMLTYDLQPSEEERQAIDALQEQYC